MFRRSDQSSVSLRSSLLPTGDLIKNTDTGPEVDLEVGGPDMLFVCPTCFNANEPGHRLVSVTVETGNLSVPSIQTLY